MIDAHPVNALETMCSMLVTAETSKINQVYQ